VSGVVAAARLLRCASCVLVLALLFASEGQAGARAAAKPRTHTVVMEATRFQPDTLTVKAGDTIVWVNKDLFPHSATASNTAFDSQAIAVGASWKFVAKKKGDFPYTCIFHPTMKGTLVVK
jgi:plastocyanin